MDLNHALKLVEELKTIIENELNKKEMRLSEFELIKNLLPEWPEAVNPILICDPKDEETKKERGEVLLSFLIKDEIENKKILDYGCGEGHLIKACQNKCIKGIGYDPNAEKYDIDNIIITNKINTIKENSPYDYIILYDVLDHVENETPVEILSKIKEFCHKDTKIIIKFHPFCSRHGGHQYQTFNKAFVHLIFTENELKELGFDIKYGQKVLYPIKTYKKWIQESGLTILSETKDTRPVEEFFIKTPLIAQRLISKFEGDSFPYVQLEQCFVDYILKI